MAVFVIIVNYRTAPLVVDCLRSLSTSVRALGGGRVLIVDNASGDGSVEDISAAIVGHGWSAWTEVVALPKNGGFAYGNNAGLRRARTLDDRFSAVVLLNPDTVVASDMLATLLGYLEGHPRCGIAGAGIVGADGTPETSAHRWPSPLGELESAAQVGWASRLLSRYAVSNAPLPTAHACDWVSGACMAIRREVLDAVGPLDEGYFLYFEEVDYCLRAKQAGWQCVFVPQARVTHFEGASTGIAIGRKRRPAYWYASRRRFFVKAYGAFGLLAADVLWAVGRASLAVRRALRLGGRAGLEKEPLHFARDLLYGDLKAIFRGEWRRIERLTGRAHAAG